MIARAIEVFKLGIMQIAKTNNVCVLLFPSMAWVNSGTVSRVLELERPTFVEPS